MAIAVCTYNRCRRLGPLIRALRGQTCAVPVEIVVVDNNSTDGTADVVRRLAHTPGTPVRLVQESTQGIVYARNRALRECCGHEFMAFIDDDELPRPGWLAAAYAALADEGADCVGGAIKVRFQDRPRPRWLDESLLGFLGELDHGSEVFWVEGREHPVWSGNVAYRMSLFDGTGLGFDRRYNRSGDGIGGGEDAMMFRSLLAAGAKIRYRPDMAVEHLVEGRRLRRGYFLRLHFTAGCRFGEFEERDYPRQWFGVPPFLFGQLLRQGGTTLMLALRPRHAVLRQMMIAAHTLGQMLGRHRRWRGTKALRGGCR